MRPMSLNLRTVLPVQGLRPRQAMRILACIVILTSIGRWPAHAQIAATDAFVFDDSSVPSIYITMDQVYLDDLFAPGNQYSDDERPAAFAMVRGLDTMRVDSVGFRFRGNTSRDSQKKSFKVSFNTFRRGQKFLGLEKLNINGEHNDPSIMRSKIGWDLFRAMGVPASRANHVRLYINGQYYGLYVNVEHVDEQFLQRVFGNDGGNLYKCLWPADLTWLGPDGAAYRPAGADRRPYDLKLKDSDLDGYDDLARFIDILNNSAPFDFQDAIESVFEVNGFLRALAVTTITGSWDSYWFLKNNYYLYSNPETGLFEFVPFDFDIILGIWWEGIYPGLDWATRDVYDQGHPDPAEVRPLVDRILAVPDFRARYTLYLKSLLAGPFDESRLQNRIMSLRAMVEAAAIEDAYRTLDYGYTVDDFFTSYTGALGGHVTHGMLPFVSERARSAAAQLDVVDVGPVLSGLEASPKAARPGTAVTVSVRVEDEDPNPNVRLVFRVDGGAEQEQSMAPAPASGLNVWSSTLTAPGQTSVIRLYVVASDAGGQSTTSPELSVPVLQELDLVINELMASNTSTLVDEAGEFDDWFEIHNPGSSELSVGGFTVTDDRSRPDKWTLPDTSIAAGGYLLVWADEDGAQGPMHANFRLSRLGEYLGLFDASGVAIDSLEFGSQIDDVSYGRSPDGGPDWRSQAWPTPGSSNAGGVGTEDEILAEVGPLSVYPNPFYAEAEAIVEGEMGGAFELFDVLGRRISSSAVALDAPARFVIGSGSGVPVPAGVYVVRYTSRTGAVRVVSVVRLR